MSSEKIQFSSFGKSIDGTTYCSGVETLAENIIEDNESDAVIVFPSKNGWASLRSESYRLTTENAEAVLPLPIYKINKFLIKPAILITTALIPTEDKAYFSLEDFVNDNGETVKHLDITNYVVPLEKWNSLLLANTKEEYLKGIYKDNTFYWEKGSSKISFLSNIYTIGSGILGGIFADNTPVYQRLIKSVLYDIGENYHYTYYETVYTLREIIEHGVLRFGTTGNIAYYRIEYVPISSKTKIRARKNTKTNVDYIQPFNQRAEINSATAFGKNMYLTAQKTGTEEITLVKNYTKLSDIPKLGSLIRHNGKSYRLVANSYKQTNTIFIQVTHRLSENWSNKSKHVSVDQKYRNWNIPQETLWRNLYWEDYFRIGAEIKIQTEENSPILPFSNIDEIVNVLKVSSESDKPIKNLFFQFGNPVSENYYKMGVTVPCSTYGIGNSMVFSASMKDNLSAGLYISTSDDTVCEEAFYCENDGTLENARIILSDGLVTDNVERAQKFYPNWTVDDTYGFNNAPKNVIATKDFLIKKDAGEALKFTYQIHLIGEDGCFFGSKFAEFNSIVKDWENKNRKFKIYVCKDYVREGVDIYTPTGTEYVLTQDKTTEEFIKLYKVTGRYGYYYLSINSIANIIEDTSYNAWIITDENNNIYLGQNKRATGNLDYIVYLQLSHNRL